MRTSSRSRTRVLVGTRTIWRATLGSLTAASRSVLRTPLKRSPMPASAPRNAVSTRSGAVAKLVSPSSEAKTAPPIRAAPHKSGQYRAAEPLHREPAPVDQTAVAPIHRKRRLVAEIDGLGIEPPICAAQPSLGPRPRSPALAIALGIAPATSTAASALDSTPAGQPNERHDAPPSGTSQRDRTVEGRSLSDRWRSPRIAHPRHDSAKNGGGMWPQCGARHAYARGPRTVSRAMLRAERELGRNCRLSAIHRGHFGGRAVDNGRSRRLYNRSWRAAALARWRVCEAPHCLRGESSGHESMAMSDVRASAAPRACRRRGRKVPGCLKSESEERETWTAESLRAASSNGEGVGSRAWAFSQESGLEETSAVDVSGQHY